VSRLPTYAPAERRADRYVHIAGLILGAAGFALLVEVAVRRAEALLSFSLIVYGCGLLGMLTCSALYHLTPPSLRKKRLQRLDHAAIFVMIAGTYTPFVLVAIPEASGAGLFAFVWIAAIFGAVLKLRCPRRWDRLSIAAYILLGWSFLVALDQMLAALSRPAAILLITGGILYTCGVAFHVSTRLPYQNAIWHACVLIAAGCHYAAIIGYVAA